MARTKKRKSDLLIYLIIIVLMGVIVVSLFNIITLMQKYEKGSRAYSQISQMVGSDSNSDENVDWNKLKKINPNTVAWIRSPGTVIDYPVMHGKDDEYYLHHLADGTYDFKGCLFVEAENDGEFKDFNTFIYGHHMKDGSMFHCLTDYKDEAYFDKHRVMYLFTPEKDYDLVVFAAVEVRKDSPLYKIDFASEKEQESYIKEVQRKSLVDTGITVHPGENIVALSTCAYDFKDARMIVYGVLRDHE